MLFWRARTRLRAIISRSSSTTRFQGVTDVVPGKDLFHATSVHRLLQRLLDLPAPEYRHHELLLDARGEKLSKSRESKTLRELRAEGVTPREARALAGRATL